MDAFFLNKDADTVSAPAVKLASAWAAVLGVNSWGDVASILAGCYTALLIGEWVWKKMKGRRRGK